MPRIKMSRVERTPGPRAEPRPASSTEKRHGAVPRRPGGLPRRYFRFTSFALAFQPSTSTTAGPFADVAVTWRVSPGSSGK